MEGTCVLERGSARKPLGKHALGSIIGIDKASHFFMKNLNKNPVISSWSALLMNDEGVFAYS
eukprot:10051-Heterococcus_DN1.PRE.6